MATETMEHTETRSESISQEEFLEGLNVDLAHEYAAVITYRTYASQVRMYGQKPALAAVPGTSNHGWGLAVDLCGGIGSFGTRQYTWMVANAGRFG